MKYKFFNENNDKLIIFFNGWGMDEKIISHLKRDGFDLLVIFDYSNFNIEFPNISTYKEKYIVAWSMGVMISSLFKDKYPFENIKKYIAINGTLKPIDDNFGIPEKIYKLTMKGFNELSCKKFMKRMFVKTPPIENFSERTLDSQKKELEKLITIKSNKIPFDKIIISSKDIIIPTQKQLNYWKNSAIIENINNGHCPFFEYESWSEIL